MCIECVNTQVPKWKSDIKEFISKSSFGTHVYYKKSEEKIFRLLLPWYTTFGWKIRGKVSSRHV